MLNSKRALKGSPERIAAQLTAEEQHQLLLVLPDRVLVSMVDELLAARSVSIPASETRWAYTYMSEHTSDRRTELSSLGMRSTAHSPPVELLATIWDTYTRLGLLDDLSWRLRDHDGPTLRHRLLGYLRLNGPRKTIRDLILASHAVSEAVCEQRWVSVVRGEEEEETVARIAWKCGYDLPRYEQELGLLHKRLQDFAECALGIAEMPSEDDRARIRSVGVNAFVSLESFLEELLAYNVWMMAEDHFADTGFRYCKEAALRAVPETLGSELVTGDLVFRWSNEGENTLGCLCAYLAAFLHWLDGLTQEERTSVVRRQADYPHYARDAAYPFAFQHTALWADTPPEVLVRYSAILAQLLQQLGQANAAGVRNGIDHKRDADRFPTPDEILACVARLKQVVDTADDMRLVPKVYWGTAESVDACGNICNTFEDYRGAAVCLWEPRMASGVPPMLFGIPYLIAPFDFLNEPNALLVFAACPRTPYRDYWLGYPRRRNIPIQSDAATDEGERSPLELGSPSQ